ncbi:glyoxalase/Bleomycin resistance /Dioxygenase superfamily protein [Rhodococcus sp. MTM3W5.2]|uniref:VOC family protein n=1 Tax=Rhodococcus sp. MTM3W5.2 TaxID=1805827 RepID=UPI00097937CD|nr:VOC family protein [Rhodococcus sp. MTM3W5.2]AQA20755.1 glyoxalase/Bleomycin resistance /Dioxygenase superfamily protein [Rhodococcus sp. MTM3W5.2]
MQVTASTISLTVDDVAASSTFFVTHLGYREQAAADGFASLNRPDAAVDIVLLQRGIEVLPEGFRDRHADGLILAFTVDDLAAQEARIKSEGVEITMALREEPWGEKLFQVTDPNGIVVQFVEWADRDAPEDAAALA